eukprot:NODE_464_length_8145_cov_0.677977.p5 type:complete len:113 gc:universal NODE_464_length_8145_cov_0.677977:6615-6953(+)
MFKIKSRNRSIIVRVVASKLMFHTLLYLILCVNHPMLSILLMSRVGPLISNKLLSSEQICLKSLYSRLLLGSDDSKLSRMVAHGTWSSFETILLTRVWLFKSTFAGVVCISA